MDTLQSMVQFQRMLQHQTIKHIKSMMQCVKPPTPFMGSPSWTQQVPQWKDMLSQSHTLHINPLAIQTLDITTHLVLQALPYADVDLMCIHIRYLYNFQDTITQEMQHRHTSLWEEQIELIMEHENMDIEHEIARNKKEELVASHQTLIATIEESYQ